MPAKKKGSLQVGLPSVNAAVESEESGLTEKAHDQKSYVSPVRRDKKGILTYVTPECHQELKILAVRKGTNLQIEFEAMIAKYLTENGLDPRKYIEPRD